MKSPLIISATLLLFITFLAGAVQAQEDRLPELESGREMRYDPASESDSEFDSRFTKQATTSRDSVYIRPLAKKPDGKSKPDENASVLGFNFLYYLIERFKLSDIVD
jgi:hypothetical protein